MLRGFWAVIDMAFRLFFRDKQTLFWGVAFPLIMMGLVGNVFGGTMNLVVSASVVVDESNPLSEGFVAALEEIPTLRVTVDDEDTALNALRNGERTVVAMLPPADDTMLTLRQVSTSNNAANPPQHELQSLAVQLYYDDAN